MLISFSYDPTIESTHHKTIRFRKVHFATDIVDTAGMVRMTIPSIRLSRIYYSFSITAMLKNNVLAYFALYSFASSFAHALAETIC